MNDPQKPVFFRTLRGFLDGDEPQEPIYFSFSATMRIRGDGIPFEEIGHPLCVQPTNLHRKGERLSARAPVYRDDAWHFKPSLSEDQPLRHHIDALWQVVQPQLDFLKSLKERFKVDVFCGYRSNCDTAGFEVPYQCLQLFTALEVPFGVSVIIA